MDTTSLRTPPQYDRILSHSQHIGFSMNADALTGSLLRTLAASKPSGALLELGTGCGLGTCWLLEGMDQSSSLEAALGLLKPGGIYIVDDMLPQSNCPSDHAPNVASLLRTLNVLPGFVYFALFTFYFLLIGCASRPTP